MNSKIDSELQSKSFPLSNLEYYRLLSSCMHFNKEITMERINKLLADYIKQCPNENEKSQFNQYLKLVSSVMGRLRRYRLRVDPEIEA